MRKAAINTLYRKVNAAAPDLRCVVYSPDGAGGGIVDHGLNPAEYVTREKLEEMTAGPNVLTVVIAR